MKLDALDHPKTLDFAARLNVGRATAIGHLELFWHFVAKHAPRGNIGKFADGAIARACDWQGDPETFLKSLHKSGFLDESEAHRYLVHDWPEHCPNWVRAQLQKLKQTFFTTDVPTDAGTSEGTYDPALVPSTRARVSKPSHTKPSQGMVLHGSGDGSEGKSSALVDDSALMDLFAAVRMAYPERAGNQSDWILAEREWRKRLDDGVSAAEMLAGVERYARYCAAGGVSGPQFVFSPSKFFDANVRRWADAWDAPKSKTDTLTDANAAAAEEARRNLFGDQP